MFCKKILAALFIVSFFYMQSFTMEQMWEKSLFIPKRMTRHFPNFPQPQHFAMQPQIPAIHIHNAAPNVMPGLSTAANWFVDLDMSYKLLVSAIALGGSSYAGWKAIQFSWDSASMPGRVRDVHVTTADTNRQVTTNEVSRKADEKKAHTERVELKDQYKESFSAVMDELSTIGAGVTTLQENHTAVLQNLWQINSGVKDLKGEVVKRDNARQKQIATGFGASRDRDVITHEQLAALQEDAAAIRKLLEEQSGQPSGSAAPAYLDDETDAGQADGVPQKTHGSVFSHLVSAEEILARQSQTSE